MYCNKRLKKYLKLNKLHYFIRNRFILCFIIKTLLSINNKKKIKKHKIKKYKNVLDTIYYFYFTNSIVNYNNSFSFNIIDRLKIVHVLHSIINSDLFFFYSTQFLLKNKTSYFFWHFFNKDNLINLFINLIMKDGKKSTSYKNVYKSLFFLKKLVGIHPLFFLKKSLYNNRFLFDIKHLTLRKRVITIPHLLSTKSQLVKSLKYILNYNLLKSWKIKKKTLSFYKKVTYLLLNNFFNNNRLNNLIKKETLIVQNNFSAIKKENFFNKYVVKLSNIVKKDFFKVKNISLTKKMKILKKKTYLIKNVKRYINFNQIFLLERYKTNLQSKNKLKTKWF